MFKKSIYFTALILSLGIFSNLSELQALPEKVCEAVHDACYKAVMDWMWVREADANKAKTFCDNTLKSCKSS